MAPRLRESVRDVLPIIAVITIFQLAVLQTPFPELAEVLVGAVLVIVGATPMKPVDGKNQKRLISKGPGHDL